MDGYFSARSFLTANGKSKLIVVSLHLIFIGYKSQSQHVPVYKVKIGHHECGIKDGTVAKAGIFKFVGFMIFFKAARLQCKLVSKPA